MKTIRYKFISKNILFEIVFVDKFLIYLVNKQPKLFIFTYCIYIFYDNTKQNFFSFVKKANDEHTRYKMKRFCVIISY